ncbi:hypothetical protein XENOCAPTIV_023984 [Xenoophorus captivus]|uniref:Uncharacterized protein n=1 Tax=Xenoophorus captivus TaxID=1517983 RepID=A0ABV0QBD3_9TELE
MQPENVTQARLFERWQHGEYGISRQYLWAQFYFITCIANTIVVWSVKDCFDIANGAGFSLPCLFAKLEVPHSQCKIITRTSQKSYMNVAKLMMLMKTVPIPNKLEMEISPLFCWFWILSEPKNSISESELYLRIGTLSQNPANSGVTDIMRTDQIRAYQT